MYVHMLIYVHIYIYMYWILRLRNVVCFSFYITSYMYIMYVLI